MYMCVCMQYIHSYTYTRIYMCLYETGRVKTSEKQEHSREHLELFSVLYVITRGEDIKGERIGERRGIIH